MLNAPKLTLAVLINAVLISPTFASEQSDAKGFVEDAKGSVLFVQVISFVIKNTVLTIKAHLHKLQLLT